MFIFIRISKHLQESEEIKYIMETRKDTLNTGYITYSILMTIAFNRLLEMQAFDAIIVCLQQEKTYILMDAPPDKEAIILLL